MDFFWLGFTAAVFIFIGIAQKNSESGKRVRQINQEIEKLTKEIKNLENSIR